MGAFYTMWAQNIRDSQLYGGDEHPAGSVPDTVPHTFGAYPSDPAWGTAYPGVVYSTWRMLGDTRLAADHYPNLMAYINFMKTKVAENGGIGALYQSYGDWCPPGPMPPKSYTSGVALLVDVQRMVELATALGKAADASALAAYRASLVADFNAAWLKPGGRYGAANGDALQTANSAALVLGGVVPPAAVKNVTAALVADVVARGHFSTGIIGMRYLHRALVAAGAGDAALATVWAPDYPSFSFEFNHPDEPATTLWELLDGPTQGPGALTRTCARPLRLQPTLL
jgi:alpha-L-rhamnosidase